MIVCHAMWCACWSRSAPPTLEIRGSQFQQGQHEIGRGSDRSGDRGCRQLKGVNPLIYLQDWSASSVRNQQLHRCLSQLDAREPQLQEFKNDRAWHVEKPGKIALFFFSEGRSGSPNRKGTPRHFLDKKGGKPSTQTGLYWHVDKPIHAGFSSVLASLLLFIVMCS